MTKFLRYIFWQFVYLFRPRALTFDAYVLRGVRRMWPWKVFTPAVWYNNDGRSWHIHLTKEEAFVETRIIRVSCYIGMETGEIVGFTLPYKVLTKET